MKKKRKKIIYWGLGISIIILIIIGISYFNITQSVASTAISMPSGGGGGGMIR